MFKFCFVVLISTWLSTVHATAVKSSKTLLILGDSLSAAYGMDYSQGWVSLLERKLKADEQNWHIANASVSGETSKGALNRLPLLIKTHAPKLILIELGANDGLRAYPIAQLKANLEKLIELSKSNGATVVLMAMRIPPNYGKRYTKEFINVYEDIARQQHVELVPFFMDKVIDNEQYMQSDNIHPNEKAQPFLLEAVWAHLQEVIGAH